MDGLALADGGGVFQGVLQFADVSWPPIGQKSSDRRRGEAQGPTPRLPDSLQEVADQELQILPSLTERGNLDGHHPESVVEILPELPLRNCSGQVHTGGGDDPDVDLPGSSIADPLEFVLLQGPVSSLA